MQNDPTRLLHTGAVRSLAWRPHTSEQGWYQKDQLNTTKDGEGRSSYVCLVRPSCDLPLCSYLDIFVNGPRRLPGRIFVKEFGLDLAVSGKVSCGLLAFVFILCVRTGRPWIFLGRSRRRIFVVWIGDADTGERFASSALPMTIRAKELCRRLCRWRYAHAATRTRRRCR